jgi:hypothetical protein
MYSRDEGKRKYGVLNEAFEAWSLQPLLPLPCCAAALGMKRAGSWGQLKTSEAEIVCRVPCAQVPNLQRAVSALSKGARPGDGFQAGTDQRADNSSSDWLGMPVAVCGCLAPLKRGEMVQR